MLIDEFVLDQYEEAIITIDEKYVPEKGMRATVRIIVNDHALTEDYHAMLSHIQSRGKRSPQKALSTVRVVTRRPR